MDTKKIQALLVAVDKGSLTSAAAELGYTQSGMTHMMNALESELGLTLLMRGKGGVKLSSAGHELLPYMRALLAADEDLSREVHALRERGGSSLRLGAYSSIAHHWVPEILADYRRLCPETQVSLTMNGMEFLYNAVHAGELDCAMVSFQEKLCQGLVWLPLWDDELLAILPKDRPVSGSAFPISGFDGQEFYMPSLGFELDILPALSAGGAKSTPIIYRTNLDDASIVSMVEHGLGLSVLSKLVVQGMRFHVQTLPLSPPAFRQLGVAVSESVKKAPAIRAFLSCAKAVVARKYPGHVLS